MGRITALKSLGFTINEIKDLMNDHLSDQEMLGILKLKKSQIKGVIDAEIQKMNHVDILIRNFEMEANFMYDITLKQSEPGIVASYRAMAKDYSDQETHWTNVVGHIEATGAKILPGCYVSYHPTEEEGIDLEVFERISKTIPPSDTIHVKEIPSEQVASVVIHGPYSLLKGAYGAIFQWIEQNGYTPTALSREIYLANPSDTEDENDYVTEIQVPVSK